jgi:hypothetical protein
MLSLVTTPLPPATCAESLPADMAEWRWDGPVPLTRVLEHVRPAYGGGTWDEALTYLYAAPAEAAVIDDLCARGANGFDEPIRVLWSEPDESEDDDDDVVPADEYTGWVIGNGMHRVAAAARLGHDTILCTTSAASDEESAAQEYVDLVFTLPEMSYSADLDPDDDLDALDWVCGWFRSFPLHDGTWVECDSFGWHGAEMTGMWTCPTSHADTLVEALRARFVEHAPPGCEGEFVVKSMRALTGAQWDAEWEAEFGDRYPGF